MAGMVGGLRYEGARPDETFSTTNEVHTVPTGHRLRWGIIPPRLDADRELQPLWAERHIT
jgi:hypothetical protein